MTYPLKFRQQALAVREKEDLTFAQTAKRFGVGITSVMRWAKNPQPGDASAVKLATKINEARRKFQEKMKLYEAAGNPIVSIDESGFSCDMPRSHGWSQQGQ